jgi:hypothetical protein
VPSPEKLKPKKLSKMMSEEKNLKVNVDLNVKINLKINQKSSEKRESRDYLESKVHPTLLSNANPSSKLLPEIKNNTKGMRYQLNIRHQKYLLPHSGPTPSSASSAKPRNSSRPPNCSPSTDHTH